jgi:hypothetical protein
MRTPTLLSEIERLEKLERDNHRLRQVAALGLIVIAVVLLMAQTSGPRRLEANEFVLKDDKGKVRGRFALLEKGLVPQLSLSDEQGRDLLTLSVIAGSPFLSFNDVRGTERVTLSIDEGRGDAGLTLRHANKAPAITMLSENEGARIVLGDAQRQGRLQLAISKLAAALALYDERGKQTVTVFAYGEGDSRLTVEDREGFKTVIGTSETVTPLTGEKHKTSVAAITMFDKNQKVIWKAP